MDSWRSSYFASLKTAFHKITVEPALLLYMLSNWYTVPALQSLFFYKVCRNTYVNDTLTCHHLLLGDTENHTNEENVVQEQSSRWFFYQTIALVLPSVVISLFMGSWSDKYGRKLPLLLPPIGGLLSIAMTLPMAVGPLLDLHHGYLLIPAFVSGCFGGYATMLMATYSYLSAVTEPEEKTIRYAFLEAMSLLANLIGSFTQGVILDFDGNIQNGFIAMLAIIMALQALASMYTLVFVKNVHVEDLHVQERQGCSCQSFFSLSSLIEGVRTLTQYRENSRRLDLHLLVAGFFLVNLSYLGYIDVLYLFVQGQGISRSLYGYFNGFTAAIAFLGTVVGTWILKRQFLWLDTSLIVLGNVSFMISLVTMSIASFDWVAKLAFKGIFWTSPLLAIFRPVSISTLRSQCSSFVSADEQGKLFAVLGAGETLLNLIASLLFNFAIWPATYLHWTGASFITSASFLAIASVLVLVAKWHMRRSECYHDILNQPLTADETDASRPLKL